MSRRRVAFTSRRSRSFSEWTRKYVPTARGPASTNCPAPDNADAAGVVTADGATYEYSAGWVFDARDDSWFEVPDRGGDAYDESVAAAGQSLVVFGGQRWSDDGDEMDGELLAETWVFEPPS